MYVRFDAQDCWNPIDECEEEGGEGVAVLMYERLVGFLVKGFASRITSALSYEEECCQASGEIMDATRIERALKKELDDLYERLVDPLRKQVDFATAKAYYEHLDHRFGKDGK